MNNEECQCQIFEGDQGWCPVHGTAKDGKVATLQSPTDEEAAWDAIGPGRIDLYPVDPNFRWTTMDCQTLKAQEMRTFHVFNSLKMMWNNLVPMQCRVGNFTEYKAIPKIPRAHRRYAIANLFNELMNRTDRTKGMDEALKTMAEHMHKYGQKILR